jgi:hypothetical protein
MHIPSIISRINSKGLNFQRLELIIIFFPFFRDTQKLAPKKSTSTRTDFCGNVVAHSSRKTSPKLQIRKRRFGRAWKTHSRNQRPRALRYNGK